MKLKYIKAVFGASVLFSLFASTAAAHGETPQLEKKVFLKNLERDDGQRVDIRDVRIAKDGGDLVVSGDIDSFVFRFAYMPNAHVDVSLKDKNGAVIKTVAAGLRRPPGKNRWQGLSFSARFKDIAANGDEFMVQAKYHPQVHGTEAPSAAD